MPFHRLLQRQLRKYLSSEANQCEISDLLNSVSLAYEESDNDRRQLERSIELTSKELLARNQTLTKQVKELKQIQGALEDSFSLLHVTLNSTNEAILVVDSNGHVRLVNDLFQSLFQIDQIEAPFSNVDSLLHLMEPLVLNYSEVEQVIRTSANADDTHYEIDIKTSNNRYIQAYSKPHYQRSELVGQVWSFRDVTELKLKEEEAKHRAQHDVLTGLPNRRLLNIRLKNALERRADNKQVYVLFIDLDGFKDVNDSLGHSIGDALLKDVSGRLECVLPDHVDHSLVRYGGDEFVIVVEDQVDRQHVDKLSQEIINSFEEPFQLGSEDVFMSASIGVAYAPGSGLDVERLISCADTAMYQAKRKGKNTYDYYEPTQDSLSEHKVKIRSQLNTAIVNDEFELFFQPKIELDSGQIIGAEALLRWQVKPGQYRSPIEFIPIAESTGQIIPISQWVIGRCCQHLTEWKERVSLDNFVLAMNISAKHFQKGLLQEDLATILDTSSADPRNIELEVTETAIMEDVALGVETLNQVRALGIRTAIDDFGTGHSSLSYLRKLPIDILKIDKSFVDEILASREDRTLVQGIVDMVHALGIKVVAEGIENAEVAEVLKEMNCDHAQGYYFCRPVPENEFLERLRQQNSE